VRVVVGKILVVGRGKCAKSQGRRKIGTSYRGEENDSQKKKKKKDPIITRIT